MSPEEPSALLPVASRRLPDELTASPVDNSTEPLSPLDALPLCIAMLPPDVTPLPLTIEIPPPLLKLLSPADTWTLPPCEFAESPDERTTEPERPPLAPPVISSIDPLSNSDTPVLKCMLPDDVPLLPDAIFT